MPATLRAIPSPARSARGFARQTRAGFANRSPPRYAGRLTERQVGGERSERNTPCTRSPRPQRLGKSTRRHDTKQDDQARGVRPRLGPLYGGAGRTDSPKGRSHGRERLFRQCRGALSDKPGRLTNPRPKGRGRRTGVASLLVTFLWPSREKNSRISANNCQADTKELALARNFMGKARRGHAARRARRLKRGLSGGAIRLTRKNTACYILKLHLEMETGR